MKVYSVRRSTKNKCKVKFGFLLLLIGTLILLICADGIIRSIIRGYPMSVASGVVLELMDSAMADILKSDDISDMSEIDGVIYSDNDTVNSITVDTETLNNVKTSFVSALKNHFKNYGKYITVSVPIGTLMGNEYTLGRGPNISFKLQFSATVTTSLKSDFSEAGINNTQHTIYMNVCCDLFLIIPWGHESRSVKTDYILAQTIISGRVPEAYTNVYDGAGDIVDDLFNYGAEID